MPDRTLLTLFDEVRRKTLWLLDTTPAIARWTPPGTANSILWHAGHALCVVEQLTAAALLHETEPPAALPPGWWRLFSWESRPAETRPDAWPAVEEVAAALREQHVRLRKTFEKLTEDDLAAAVYLPVWWSEPRPARWILIHALHDEANHGGEMWLLRKLAPP